MKTRIQTLVLHRATGLLFALLIILPASLPAQNLLTNPGFETGNTSGWLTLGSPTLSVETRVVHSGTYATVVTNRTASYMSIGQSLQTVLQPGRIYNVSAWVRLATGDNQTMGLILQQVDDNGTTYYGLNNSTVSTNGWTQMVGQFTFNYSGTLNSMVLYVEMPSSATTAYYIDDASVAPQVASADTTGFGYANNGDGTCTITNYTGPGGAVAIPSNINGLSVISIGYGAFAYNTTITSMTIPSGVPSIGNYAFYYATLNSVAIPNSVTNIGYAAFAYCFYLYNDLTIPSSVTTVGDLAFYYCSGLSTLTLKNNDIGYEEFENCVSVSRAAIGGSATNIGTYAFLNCSNLTSATIPSSVTSVGNYAFLNCGALTNVTIGNQITAQGEFMDCANLTTVTINNNITNDDLGLDEFSQDPVANLIIGTTVTNVSSSLAHFETSSLYDNFPNLTNITVSLSNPAYSGVSGVLFNKNRNKLALFPEARHASYIIPSTVTSIGYGAFAGSAVISIVIPSSVISIEDRAFAGTSITGITIPYSVTSIGDDVFDNCSRLTSVTIGNGVTNLGIGEGGGTIFGTCSQLTAINVAAGNPFYSSLNGVLFDQNQTTLIEYPLGLTGSYTVPNSVTSIGDGAFENCSGFDSVTIPSSVTNIGDGAFLDCASLASAYFEGNAPANDGVVFSGGPLYLGTTPTVYYLPDTTGWSSSFGSAPTALWNPQAVGAGMSGGYFGFNITGPINAVIVVEACADLSNPVWLPVSTNTLSASGNSSFIDLQSGNYPNRYYRFRSP